VLGSSTDPDNRRQPWSRLLESTTASLVNRSSLKIPEPGPRCCRPLRELLG